MDERTTGVVPEERVWWKEAVFYQIYPRSFKDSDGDGVGDLRGIIEMVDYLEALGVDCVWLSPVYESPDADYGYDVADYRAIDPRYGSMADWDRLLSELHDREIRLVMDLVVNHTSTEHHWFQRSREGDPDYAGFYHWRSGEDGPPNNWESHFDIPAWSHDEERGEYYLHLFTRDQPDLNWESPAVREEIQEIVSWWLERGVDGFRLDVVNEISKVSGLPDGDPGGDLVGAEQHTNGPRMHEFFAELADEGFGEHRDRVTTIGECSDIDPETALDVTGRRSALLDMVIFFGHTNLDGREDLEHREWELTELKAVMQRWQDAVAEGTWVALYHSNHDQPRAVSRYADPEYRYESATMLAAWLHGHRGSPFIYQGEEIGMSNVAFESPEDLEDPWTRNHWANARDAGAEFEDVREDIERLSRDNARTPMQWDDSPHAGFTDGDPWMPVGDDYETVNVAADRASDRSVFEFYRELIALRKADDVLVYGDFEMLLADHERLYAFRRHLAGADHELLFVCNFSAETVRFDPPAAVDVEAAEVVLTNASPAPTDPTDAALGPYEAVVYRLA
jgi:glycosidase